MKSERNHSENRRILVLKLLSFPRLILTAGLITAEVPCASAACNKLAFTEGAGLGELSRLQQEKIEELVYLLIRQEKLIQELLKKVEEK